MNHPSILVIDDEPVVQASLAALLEGEQYYFVITKDGPEGLEVANKMHPDVILLDVMMPGMDGYEVCQKLRADPQLAEIPILMITALDDRESKLRGLEAGADDFLPKPFDRVELRARLRTVTRLDRFRKLYNERLKLENALNELQQAYDETIKGWSRAIDLRDADTEGHSQRVMALTVQLAIAAGVPEQEMIHISRGALLHDIGKLGIPDGILRKPGKLTKEEYLLMQKHPQWALDMLSPIQYLHPALDIPYCHHEKWDGTGYPRGLKGEEIPLSARVFAIVDVWDALISERPYRAAWSQPQAKDYICEQSGTHFDPKLVKLFFGLLDKNPSPGMEP
jgi:putative two-component system response regulator